MISSKIETLTTVFFLAEALKEQVQEQERIGKFLTLIEEKNVSLLNALCSFGVLYRRIANEFPAPPMELFQSTLQKVKQDLTGETAEQDYDQLVQLIQAEETKYRTLWQQWIQSRNKDVLSVLNLLKNFFPDDGTISNLISFLENFKNRWPITDQVIDQYEQRVQEAHNKLNQLNTSADVQNFLKKVLDKSATIADLSDDVKKWLVVHGMMTNLKIRWGDSR